MNPSFPAAASTLSVSRLEIRPLISKTWTGVPPRHQFLCAWTSWCLPGQLTSVCFYVTSTPKVRGFLHPEDNCNFQFMVSDQFYTYRLKERERLELRGVFACWRPRSQLISREWRHVEASLPSDFPGQRLLRHPPEQCRYSYTPTEGSLLCN